MFELDPRLKNDTIELGDWALCKVLLMNDAQYPWIILVPRLAGVVELFDLNAADQHQLLMESMQLASLMKREFNAHKMNVANLGNVVSQLHIHHVARFANDAAWPKPVWGLLPAKPYDQANADLLVERLRGILFQ